MRTVIKLGSFSNSAVVRPAETPVPADGGVGKFMTDSSACREVTRKKINKKKTISTIAVMSIRSSGWGRCGGSKMESLSVEAGTSTGFSARLSGFRRGDAI